MAGEARRDVTVNGAGTVAAGHYENVTVNGGGTITGELVCTALRINGAGTCNGPVKAATISVNGSATFDEPVQVGEMTVNGQATIRGGLGVSQLVLKGSLTAEGGVAAHDIDLKGMLRTAGDVTTTTFRGEGALEAGAVKAEQFDLTVYGSSKVRTLEATRATLRAPGSLGAFIGLFTDTRFNAESIRASEVWAEHTVADVVSAGNATIGRESRIGTLVYSGTFSAVDDAKVTESRKAEPATQSGS
jgi:cytoskeletal protein CcmA (bactofilin family)